MSLRTTNTRHWMATGLMTVEGAAGAEGGAGGAGAGAGGAEGGGAAGGTGEGAGAAGGAEKPYYESFESADLRTNPTLSKFKTPEELAGAYVSLEKRYGIEPSRRIDLPADQSKPEEMRGVWTKLGLPDKPEGYGLKLDDKATDDDKAMLGEFTNKAHEWGLPAPFAKQVMDFWLGKTSEAAAAYQQKVAEQKQQGEQILREAWGQAYDRKGREVGALILKHGGPEMVKALDQSAFGNNAYLVKMLGAVVDAMAEPGDLSSRSGESFRETGGALSPDEAKRELRRLEGDTEMMKALRTREHPRHKEITDRRNDLARMAEGVTNAA